MDSRIQSAVERKKTCNCAQAVIATYADKVGITEEQAMNLGNAFGSGMGNMDGTCGALTGAAIIVGLATGDKVSSRHILIKPLYPFAVKRHKRPKKLWQVQASARPLFVATIEATHC